jgi:undecaprenyl-diphosphatase
MVNFIRDDSILTKLLSQIFPHNIFFDYLFSFFSLKGGSIFIWILIIALVLFLEERKNPGVNRRDKKFLIIFFGTFLITSFFTDILLKNYFRRPRPYPIVPVHYNLIANTCPVDFSFPSGHAAAAFAAAGVLSYFDKRRRGLYYTIAVLISYSRIYLGCHYLADVVAGALIGYLISKATLLLFSRDTFPFRRKN